MMQTYKVYLDEFGYYTIDLVVGTETWLAILVDAKFSPYIDVLLKFYEQDNYQSTCKYLSDRYGQDSQYYNAKITALAKAVQQHLNQFEIISTEDKVTYWPIVMKGKSLDDGLFQWTLRTELIAALKIYINNRQQNRTNMYGTKNNDLIQLLKYKKQIILQGPPGTGKTRLAKEIAEQIISDFDIYKCLELLKDGYEFPFIRNDDIVSIKETDSGMFILSRKVNGFDATFTKDDVLNCFLSKDYLSDKFTSRGKYVVRVLVSYWIANLNETNSPRNEQIKIVQFHPAYTYEDFVRGIVAKPNTEGDGIVYEAENKLLGYLAQIANENYRASQTDINNTSVEMNVFEAFIEMIKEKMTLNDFHKYDITEAVYLFDADETRFKYKGDNWKAHSKGLNMKFSELNKIIESGAQDRQDIKKMPQLEELTRQHATYFMKVVEQYYTFRSNYKSPNLVSKPILKNYVLIIDEINRANLSAVLGELIYALEYRGDAVESMYEVDGENKLILPPNLYIIGTMNTADRSVGHIDYAIRRRFAFVDVPSKDLAADSNLVFDQKLFNQVQQFIKEHISNEFDVTDIQLGHSYFIDKSNEGGSMAIRLQYEIKPILLEYVKDGVLVGDDLVSRINQLNSSI